MSKKKASEAVPVDWKQMGISTAASLGTMLTLTALGTWLVHREWLGTEWMNYLAAGILLLGSFAGGLAALPGGIITLPMSAAGTWLALLGLALPVFHSFPAGAGTITLPVLAGYAVAALLTRNRKSKSGRYRKRRRR